MNKNERSREVSEFQFNQHNENSWDLSDEVHIWRFPATSVESSLLTPEEKQIANRYRLEGDRSRFSVGRQALKILISKYISVRPLDISISSKNGGKPFICIPDTDIHFNISHSGEWVLIVLAHDESGIDVEKVNQEFDYIHLLEEHFNEAEKSFISESADPVSAFYFLWTRKEALVKAGGTGLLDDMKQVSVLNMDSSLYWQKRSWAITSFQISAFYPGAVVYPCTLKTLRFFDGSTTFISSMTAEK